MCVSGNHGGVHGKGGMGKTLLSMVLDKRELAKPGLPGRGGCDADPDTARLLIGGPTFGKELRTS